MPLLLQEQALAAGESQAQRASEVKESVTQSTKRREERNRCKSHGWNSAFKVPPATETREQRKALAGDGVTGKSAWQREEHGETGDKIETEVNQMAG